jgi:hypothetical protein
VAEKDEPEVLPKVTFKGAGGGSGVARSKCLERLPSSFVASADQDGVGVGGVKDSVAFEESGGSEGIGVEKEYGGGTAGPGAEVACRTAASVPVEAEEMKGDELSVPVDDRCDVLP